MTTKSTGSNKKKVAKKAEAKPAARKKSAKEKKTPAKPIVSAPPPGASPAHVVAYYFSRSGYCRVPDVKRRKKESRTYKMGYETRISVYKNELKELRQALKNLGLLAGRPYAKKNKFCLPLYGKSVMDQVWAWTCDYGTSPQ